MAIEVKEVKTKKEIKAFVDFQYNLYKGESMWVPPFKKDEIKALSETSNPAMKNCNSKFWLAVKDGKIAGRIGGIINNRYIKKTGEKIARFSRFEAIDDHEVIKALILTAEQWAKDNDMIGIDGPLGFTNLDHQGMLIEGFEHLPSVASEYHKNYYKKHLEALGYTKEIDWIEFRVTIPEVIPERAIKVADTVKERFGIKVRTFTNKNELKAHAKSLFKLMNESFSELFSFVPFDDEVIEFYVNKYMPVLSPKFVKLIFDKSDKLVGFIIPLPSLSKAMQKANGKLFPFGWYHLMDAYKNLDTIDLLLTGIDPKLQGMGYSALLMVETQKTAQEAGAKFAETTGMIETNSKAIQHWKNYEHIQHKRKRCFIKMF